MSLFVCSSICLTPCPLPQIVAWLLHNLSRMLTDIGVTLTHSVTALSDRILRALARHDDAASVRAVAMELLPILGDGTCSQFAVHIYYLSVGLFVCLLSYASVVLLSGSDASCAACIVEASVCRCVRQTTQRLRQRTYAAKCTFVNSLEFRLTHKRLCAFGL